jgi:exonuclease SbcC
MRLDRLYLKNFKRFRDQEIIFHDGITGVIGNNGAGKSTIVEAILFALYGIKSTGLEGNFLVSSFASPRDKAEVRLEFAVRGDPFTIARTFRKGSSGISHEVWLNRGGDLLATGVSDVDAQIYRILGMRASDFKNTVFAGQKDLLSLMDETPGSRKNWFMRVLGIDFLKKESDSLLKDQMDAIQNQLYSLEVRIDELKEEEMHSYRESITGEQQTLQEGHDDLISQKGELEREMKKIESEINSHLQKKERFLELKGNIRSGEEAVVWLGKERERLEGERDEIEEIEAEFNNLAVNEEKYTALKSRLDTLSQKKDQHDQLISEISQVSGIIQHLVEQKTRINERLSELEGDEERIRFLEPRVSRRTELIAQRDALHQKEPEYENLARQQRLVQATFAELKRRAQEMRTEIGKLEGEVEVRPALDELRDLILEGENTRDSLISRISANREQLRQIGGERDEIERHLLEIQRAGEEGSCPTCNRPLGNHYPRLVEEFHRNSDALQIRAEMLRTHFEDLARQRDDIEVNLQKNKEEYQALHDMHARINALLRERSVLMEQVEECLKQLSDFEEKIAGLQFDPEGKRNLENEILALEEVWVEYREVSERIRQKQGLLEDLSKISRQTAGKQDQLDRLMNSRESLGFEPEDYAVSREELRRLEPLHHQFVVTKSRIEGKPGILQRIDQVNSDLTRRESEIQELRNAQIELDFSPGHLSVLEAKRNECGRQHESLVSEISGVEGRLQSLGEKLEGLEIKEQRLAGYKKQHGELLREQDLVKITRQVMGEYIIYLLSVVRMSIEGEVGRVLGQITDGRYEHVLIDDDFSVYVSDLGGSYPANRFSGGEQDDIAIALRIALSKYLAELYRLHDSTFLIFDEIFGSQDEERRNYLIQALRTQESHFPQIFLISHISDIQGEFSTTMQVEMVTDETSRIMELE